MTHPNREIPRPTCHALLPDIRYLRELFRLDIEAGTLIWNQRPRKHFRSDQACGAWNTKYAGKVAGVIGDQGYVRVRVDTKIYRAHRIVFALATGSDPAGKLVDHRNGDPSDNRPCNLRLATNSQNNCNRRRLSSRNSSGVTGVFWEARRQRWRAFIGINGRLHELGSFVDKSDAIAARASAESKLYGSFAPTPTNQPNGETHEP